MSIDSIISLILTDKRLSALRKKIVSGKGTFSDTFDYTSYSANLMGQLFSGEVLDMPEEERKSTCISLLRDRYSDINALLDTTQRALDKAQGLALAPRHVPFDEERAAQIGDSLTDKTVPDETIVRRAGSAPVTAVRSMHDDYIEENAEFRSKAGLQCYINRVTDGKCCKWCSKMAGRFEYGDEPDGIFRRHDNCGCSVTYECGRQRQNVWTKKTWEVPETDAGAPPPTVFSQEQARKTEQEKLAQIVHKPSIDKLAESGIIESGQPYLESKPKLEKHEIEDCYKTSNPKFKESEEYRVNCQRSVMAYEARRRGYDVIAKPALMDNDRLRKMKTNGWPDVFKNGFSSLEVPEGNSVSMVKESILKIMASYGDNARAIVRVQWKFGGGHVFIAEQVKGKTVFIDPQTGKRNVSYYFWPFSFKPSKTRILRIDDKEFTSLIEKCVE